MYSYIVEPLSRIYIRQIVRRFKSILGVKYGSYINVVALLDILSKKIEGFSYQVVPDKELPKKVFATTNIQLGIIKIKQQIFDNACDGDGFARFCIAHEIGHYILLKLCGFQLAKTNSKYKIPKYMDPEWQAECFAGELLMGYDAVKNFTIQELVSKCCVTTKAANYQYNMFRKKYNMKGVII